MEKKVYFCGSIRGGRADVNLYQEIIVYIKAKGCDVLTEHIGYTKINLQEQGRKRDEAIYEQDTAWLKESDLVIAECTSPSLGVGYELAYAEKLGKPVFILYDHSRVELSAMLTGNRYFHIHPYTGKEDALRFLDTVLGA